jgi:hypothetical protein
MRVGRVITRRMVPYIGALGLFTLSACQSTAVWEHIGMERASRQTYFSSPYDFTSGARVQLIFRLYTDEGRVAVCGLLSGDLGLVDTTLTEAWFAQSTLMAKSPDGEAKGLVSGAFLKLHKPSADIYDADAHCVRTAVPWDPVYDSALVWAKGPRRVVVRF